MKLIPNNTIYAVDEAGVVMNTKTGRILKCDISQVGYLRVTLPIWGKRQSVMIHRLVAITHIPNPLGKPQVNHKDSNKLNNNKSNLEWVTVQENMLHFAGLDREKYDTLSRKNKGKKYPKIRPVVQRTLDGIFVKRYPSVKQTMREFGMDVRSALSGRYQTCGGFKWEYSDL